MSKWLKLWSSPLNTPQQWGLVLVIALLLAFAPQVTPNDWSLNTDGLYDGLKIYDNPDYVYPPWALILLWPYRLMTAPGSLILTGLVIAWLVYTRRWPLALFFAIIINPYFIFTLLFSNVDILVMVLPVLLWEAARGKRWQPVAWGLALALLLLKPQGAVLVIPYLLWRSRDRWRDLLLPLGIVALLTIPISLAGSPLLILQWLENIRNPSPNNIARWDANSVSLGGAIGLIPAALVIGLVLLGLYWLMQRRGKPWTREHTYTGLFLAALMLSPYTSNQSIIVPLAFIPSWPAVIFQYAGTFISDALGIYSAYDSWWTLLFGLVALWFYRPPIHPGADASAAAAPDQRPPVLR